MREEHTSCVRGRASRWSSGSSVTLPCLGVLGSEPVRAGELPLGVARLGCRRPLPVGRALCTLSSGIHCGGQKAAPHVR